MAPVTIELAPHPLLALHAFATRFAAPLDQSPSGPWLLGLLALDAAAPLSRDEQVRADVRDLFRHGGYHPTGRGKPSSEYLVKAAAGGKLGGINLAVDACNVISLHSGLPISVVDLAHAAPPFRVALAPPEARYVFNPAGQEIRFGGLVCLCDAAGPCANGVKDSQRSKTDAATTATLSLIWGPRAHAERTERAARWYRALLERAGAETTPARIVAAP